MALYYTMHVVTGIKCSATVIKSFSRTLYREGEAKFLRCSLNYEGAYSIMEPAEFCIVELSLGLENELWIKI